MTDISRWLAWQNDARARSIVSIFVNPARCSQQRISVLPRTLKAGLAKLACVKGLESRRQGDLPGRLSVPYFTGGPATANACGAGDGPGSRTRRQGCRFANHPRARRPRVTLICRPMSCAWRPCFATARRGAYGGSATAMAAAGDLISGAGFRAGPFRTRPRRNAGAADLTQ